MLELVDLSHYQTVSSWMAVKDAGIAGVIAKATEGTTFVDPAFASHINGAHSVGLPIGAYHFARPDQNPGDAVAEAEYFCARLGLFPALEFIPWLDLEAVVGLAASQLDDWVLTWLDRVHTITGRTGGVYCATWFSGPHLEPNPALAAFPLWVAWWKAGATAPSLPAPWASWALWQYGGSAVPGIGPGNVDRNRCPDLAPLLSGAVPPPIPVPPPTGTVEVSVQLAIVKAGSAGQAVKNAQGLLNAHGSGLATDGAFGPLTTAATKSFQASRSLVQDGIIGAKTWGALLDQPPA